jgi:hypothetical protein
MTTKRRRRRTSLVVPIRYLPSSLSAKDKAKQAKMLLQARKKYKEHTYVSRPTLSSFHNQTSKHILRAKRMYHMDSIRPSPTLAKKTGCSLGALKQIVKKGEGAYFSSGSRPNQTAKSWGIARLASSITAGKAAAVDFPILAEGCNHRKKAYRLAKQARRKYGRGNSPTRRIRVPTR